jgi:hypothetical protein
MRRAKQILELSLLYYDAAISLFDFFKKCFCQAADYYRVRPAI